MEVEADSRIAFFGKPPKMLTTQQKLDTRYTVQYKEIIVHCTGRDLGVTSSIWKSTGHVEFG
jgi:hypothetical protein